ncbi:MAG: PEP/pyruvate-binding domain-containing protein [Nanoarchaeota archaeon]
MTEQRNLGGKGKGLDWLVKNQKLGYKVPRFDGIDISFSQDIQKQAEIAKIASVLSGKPYVAEILPEQIAKKVKSLTARFGKQAVAIRSSSSHEDGNHSFAGVYDSEIVDAPSLESNREAVMKVYQSLNSPRAIKYRAEKGIKDDEMAVIFQRFVEPDFSGVVFTSNPSYPRDLTIEFSEGRNKVVEGTGRTYIVEFDKKRGRISFKSESCDSLGVDVMVLLDKLFREATKDFYSRSEAQ